MNKQTLKKLVNGVIDLEGQKKGINEDIKTLYEDFCEEHSQEGVKVANLKKIVSLYKAHIKAQKNSSDDIADGWFEILING